MSKTREDNLREAAIEIIKQNVGYHGCIEPEDVEEMVAENDPILECMIDCMLKYHQSLQPVDVEALKAKFYKECYDKDMGMFEKNGEDIFDWFLTHLQQAAPEKDAIGFHEWMDKEGWILTDFENMLYCKIPDNVIEYKKSEMKSGKQLFTEYKQYKTNSDEKSNS